MNTINDVYYHIKKKDFYKSQFKHGNTKRNILFVDPIMSNFDLYTMIIPCLYMKDDTHATAITGLYRYSELNEKPNTEMSYSEVKWADVIVIPMSLEAFSEPEGLFEELRSINPKIKIIHTVEFDFYEMTNDHQALQFEGETKDKITPENLKEIKQGMINQYAENCAGADRLIVLNPKLAKKLLGKGFSDVKCCPIHIDKNLFTENIDFQETIGVKNTAGIVFMSIELSEATLSAFKGYLPTIKKIRDKHGNKFRLIVVTTGKGKSLFKDLDFEVGHISRGSIVNQYKAIVKSSADFHLILNKQNRYSSNTESLFTYVERGMFGIPIASIPVSPYKEIIKSGENGYIIKKKSDLIDLVDSMIKDKAPLIELSTRLKDDVTTRFQIDKKKIEHLTEMFFEEYSLEAE